MSVPTAPGPDPASRRTPVLPAAPLRALVAPCPSLTVPVPRLPPGGTPTWPQRSADSACSAPAGVLRRSAGRRPARVGRNGDRAAPAPRVLVGDAARAGPGRGVDADRLLRPRRRIAGPRQPKPWVGRSVEDIPVREPSPGDSPPSRFKRDGRMPIPTSTTPTALPNQIATVRSAKWKPWLWRSMNQAISLSNARGASIELSRRRVEREEIDIFVARLDRDRRPRRGPRP